MAVDISNAAMTWLQARSPTESAPDSLHIIYDMPFAEIAGTIG